MASEPATLTISAVARKTGIPVSTLRFYERELSGLFHIRKTSGGHRRYAASDVERFSTIRRLTESEGLGLAEVRRAVLSRGENEALRDEVERLTEILAASTAAVEEMALRLSSLEARVAALEAVSPRKKRWLGRGE